MCKIDPKVKNQKNLFIEFGQRINMAKKLGNAF